LRQINAKTAEVCILAAGVLKAVAQNTLVRPIRTIPHSAQRLRRTQHAACSQTCVPEPVSGTLTSSDLAVLCRPKLQSPWPILGDFTYGTLGIEACYLSQGSKLVHEASSKARPPLPERCRSDIPASPFRHRGLRCVPAFRRLTPLLDQRTGIPSLRFNR